MDQTTEHPTEPPAEPIIATYPPGFLPTPRPQFGNTIPPVARSRTPERTVRSEQTPERKECETKACSCYTRGLEAGVKPKKRVVKEFVPEPTPHGRVVFAVLWGLTFAFLFAILASTTNPCCTTPPWSRERVECFIMHVAKGGRS